MRENDVNDLLTRKHYWPGTPEQHDKIAADLRAVIASPMYTAKQKAGAQQQLDRLLKAMAHRGN